MTDCRSFTCSTPAGLVLAAEACRSVVLPDWLRNGIMPDAKDFVTPEEGDGVPFG